jgi:cold shock CspA family protein
MEGYRTLREGKEVEFEALATPKGLQVSEVCFR